MDVRGFFDEVYWSLKIYLFKGDIIWCVKFIDVIYLGIYYSDGSMLLYIILIYR